LSEPGHPAIGLLEFDSISAGIVAGDAMAKAAPIRGIYAGTVHPGRYLVMVSGDAASVDEAMDAGNRIAGESVRGSVFLPDIHPDVTSAVVADAPRAPVGDEALGIVESATVSGVIDAADAGVKAAEVELAGIRLADGLGGKAYILFSGEIAMVEAAVAAAEARLERHGTMVRCDVIAQLHEEMAWNLRRDLTFLKRVSTHDRGG